MDTILVTKINHTHMVVRADRSIEAEIHDHFSFFADGYKFMPTYKYGVWDGKIYIYNLVNHRMPVGLYQELCEFADEREYQVQITSASLSFERTDDVYELDIPLTNKGKPIIPHDYQLAAVNHAIGNKRGIILSPTGSGKSLIIYLLVRHFSKHKFLIAVPTTSLVEQMYGDFADYSEHDKSFTVSDSTVKRIYAEYDKGTNARVVVSTWQSIYKMPEEFFEQFTAVIGDEAHTFKAKSLTRIMDLVVNADVRIGTTGTLDGSKVNEKILVGSFGPKFVATSTRELMDRDLLAKSSIEVLHIKHTPENCKLIHKAKYPDEISFITQMEERNTFIARLALAQKMNTLVLFRHVDTHGKPLYEKIKALNKDPNRKVFFIAGEITTLEREEIRHILEIEPNAILVASIGTFSVGVNVKNLHVIIFASPSKSLIQILQAIGRGLRVWAAGYGLKIYDLIDDFSNGKKHQNHALRHGVIRLKIYAKEKHQFIVRVLKL